MAKASAPKPGTAVATSNTKLPVAINDIFKAEMATFKTRIQEPSGQWIKVEGKEFVIPDGRRSETLDAVIIDFICNNTYYDTDYVEGTFASPACFGLGFDVDEVLPSKQLKEPVSSACISCPNKAWGSHRNGRGGKACTDNRNYVIMELDPEGKPKLWLMRASATAVKPFDAYANNIASTMARPLRGVMTRISFDPGSKYPSQRWESLGPNAVELVMIAQSQLDEARRMLQIEPSITAANDDDGAKPAAATKPRARAGAGARR